VSYLHYSYYNIEWGSSVWAQVKATNFYGDSPISDPGNGGLLLVAPDAPISLTEIPGTRGPTQIGLEWEPAAEVGGAPILDFNLEYKDLVSTTFTSLDQNVLSLAYLATGLETGMIYTFRIQARNSHGYSGYSSELEILCVAAPAAPTSVTTTLSGPNVIATWTDETDNGSPLIA
jgi:hypothetical protein